MAKIFVPNISPYKVIGTGAPKPHREPCTLDFYPKLDETIGYPITEAQKDIIEYVEGSSLVKATAGAGKTTTMTAKIGRMVLVNGIPASKILAMSFSKYSAKDLEKRYYELFPQLNAKGVQFSTIHSFAFKVVREQYHKQNKHFLIIEGQDSPIDKRKYLSQLYFDFNKKYATGEEIDALTTDISFIKNRLMKPTSSVSEIRNFVEIFNEYEDMKQKKGCLDFDDMLTECYRLLKTEKSIQEHYSSLYDHVVLDEAQDVSPVQAEIVKHMTLSKDNLTLVADDDQTIYQWRGSQPSFVIDYASNFPKTVLFDLGVNYRCAPNILGPAKNLIERNKGRLPKKIEAHKQEAGIFKLVDYDSPRGQYENIMRTIKDMTLVQLNDSAILFRNNESAVPLILNLYENNFPFYVKADRIGFFTMWLVKDIINALKLIANPGDMNTFRLIAQRLDLRISSEILETLPKTDNIFIEISKSGIAPNKTKEKAALMGRKIRIFQFKSIEKSIDFVIRELKYEKYLDYRVENGEGNDRFFDHMIQMMKYIGRDMQSIDLYRNKMVDLFQYIQGLKKGKGRTKSGISLMTIHSSKGLEFENVFVVDMIEGVFPGKSAEESPYLMEEERRLCYVAVTRAKNASYIYYDKNSPSSFIEELKAPAKKMKAPLKKKSSNVRTPMTKEAIKEISIKGCHKIESREDMIPGAKVQHSSFGPGIVIDLTEDNLKVQFDNFDIKVLSYAFVAKRGYLQLSDN